MDAEEVNPYASPALPAEDYDELLDELLAGQESCWRDAEVLVVCLPARLPSRCVKTNEVVGESDREVLSFTWHAGWLQFVPDNVSIPIPFSGRWRRRRMLCIATSFLLAALGLIAFVSGILFRNPLALAGPLIWLIAAIPAGLGSHGLRLVRVHRDFAWLAGTSPSFLAELPEWPAGKPWVK